jgi:hypothetical protein
MGELWAMVKMNGEWLFSEGYSIRIIEPQISFVAMVSERNGASFDGQWNLTGFEMKGKSRSQSMCQPLSIPHLPNVSSHPDRAQLALEC